MENLPQKISLKMVLATRAALTLLFLATVAAQIGVVGTGRSMASAYPEFAHLEAPLVGTALLFGICIEVVLVITAILVGYIRDERIFGSTSRKLIDVMAATLAAATAILMGTLFLIPGPPALGLLVIGGALVGATLTMVLLVLRSLLRKTAFMRAELDGVV